MKITNKPKSKPTSNHLSHLGIYINIKYNQTLIFLENVYFLFFLFFYLVYYENIFMLLAILLQHYLLTNAWYFIRLRYPNTFNTSSVVVSNIFVIKIGSTYWIFQRPFQLLLSCLNDFSSLNFYCGEVFLMSNHFCISGNPLI